MNKLKFTEYVYTTETEINAAEQAEVAKKRFRDTKLKVSQQEEDEVLKVSAPFSYIDTGYTNNSSKYFYLGILNKKE